MNKLILYHGSFEIVKNPLYGIGKIYNDYGQGFYCTESLEIAKEWACIENVDGYCNKYEIDLDNLSVLNLSSEKYSILHWLALLVENRKFRISTPVMKVASEWLKKNYLIDLSKYDIVIGYRADDSYFAIARAFLSNEISLEQLSYAMHLGKLGEQVVLKSPKAFNNIKFISYEVVDNTVYYPKRKVRDEVARNAFYSLLEEAGIEGLYIRDIIRKESVSDDACL